MFCVAIKDLKSRRDADRIVVGRHCRQIEAWQVYVRGIDSLYVQPIRSFTSVRLGSSLWQQILHVHPLF